MTLTKKWEVEKEPVQVIPNMTWREVLEKWKKRNPIVFFKLLNLPWHNISLPADHFVGNCQGRDPETGERSSDWLVYEFKYLDGVVYQLRPVVVPSYEG